MENIYINNFKNNQIQYQIKHSRRARRLRIAVHCDAGVVVTLPKGMSEEIMMKFLQSKAGWIKNKIDFFKKYLSQPARKLGSPDYLDKKESACRLIKERIAQINQIYNFSFNKIFIKNHKTVWGSCSRKGNLNFNYKLIFLPAELIDYVIAHELCHLREFNHSKKFWCLVAQAAPNYIALRKELKRKSLELR